MPTYLTTNYQWLFTTFPPMDVPPFDDCHHPRGTEVGGKISHVFESNYIHPALTFRGSSRPRKRNGALVPGVGSREKLFPPFSPSLPRKARARKWFFHRCITPLHGRPTFFAALYSNLRHNDKSRPEFLFFHDSSRGTATRTLRVSYANRAGVSFSIFFPPLPAFFRFNSASSPHFPGDARNRLWKWPTVATAVFAEPLQFRTRIENIRGASEGLKYWVVEVRPRTVRFLCWPLVEFPTRLFSF